jgi:hypothetical protein
MTNKKIYFFNFLQKSVESFFCQLAQLFVRFSLKLDFPRKLFKPKVGVGGQRHLGYVI